MSPYVATQKRLLMADRSAGGNRGAAGCCVSGSYLGLGQVVSFFPPTFDMVANTSVTRVQGVLKRRIIIDILAGFSTGCVAAFGWWHLYHQKRLHEREQWYVEYAKAKGASQ